ncbi:MerR family transcriptional regulator [Yersinia kristensenii]|uniref:MerR family transcriptional regulator n=1 Tax=Yersinia kristensenii TaxID=28152 RepID=UPI001C609A70|nr:MerR family transcriptional regulator [Yersinia kristensenii]MBW5825112.1 MerR family transcriptional regulator [Yersinia kristensenii]
MLISKFSAETGLSRDTIRFYVRLGLFKPDSSKKGGRNPYQLFTRDDIQTAEVIRVGQSLGMSLKEIASLDIERRENGISGDRLRALLQQQLADLEAKEAELAAVMKFIRAKLDWLENGQQYPEPNFGHCGCQV